MPNLLRTEQVPGQDREIRYFDDGTSTAVNMPQGYYTNQSSGVIPSPTVSEDRISANKPTTPTIGDIVGQYETPEERAYREQYGQNLLNESQATPDLNKIRQDTLARYQAEIDAINSSYATKKAAERIQGQGRLGSTASIQARRGLLGSDFGAAQTDTTNQYNAELVDAIEQERLAKVSSIMSEANRFSQEEFDKKMEAKRTNADEYLKFIGESAARRQDNTAKMAAWLYQQGTYDTMTPAELKKLADQLKVNVDTLKAVYKEYSSQAEAAQAKAEAEAMKEGLAMEKTASEISNIQSQPERELIKQGYTYVNTPAKRDELIKQGYEMTTLGGRTYAKAPELTTKTMKIGKTDYLLTYDKQGNVVNKTALGSTGGGRNIPTTTTPPTTKFNKVVAKKDAEDYLKELYGSGETAIMPDEYVALRSDWEAAGGDAFDFDTYFYKRLYQSDALKGSSVYR